MKRLGLRFGSFNQPGAIAVAVVGEIKALRVIDADTGEEIENVFAITTKHDVNGLVEATVSFYPTMQMGVPEE